MTPEQFTYWLQGFIELSNPTHLTTRQLEIVKDHLASVFDKKTPNRNTVGWTPEWPVMPGTTAPVGPYTYPDITNDRTTIIC
jgi:hypothetical protein